MLTFGWIVDIVLIASLVMVVVGVFYVIRWIFNFFTGKETVEEDETGLARKP